MGVPGLYRWLIQLLLQSPQSSQLAHSSGSGRLFTDDQCAALQIDNLYIDMNSLIHPSVKPQPDDARDGQVLHAPPSNDEQRIANVLHAVDRCVSKFQPKRLLYMAIDGVAPRAKMNQQRQRRFRAAMDASSSSSSSSSSASMSTSSWDSNVISPGTEFMHQLSRALFEHILAKCSAEWRNLTVIWSDVTEPGEGEHKIAAFLRKQKPNDRRHAIHGLDGDLTFLGIGTQQKDIWTIRENRQQQSNGTCGERQTHVMRLNDVRRAILERIRPSSSSSSSSSSSLSTETANHIMNDWTLLCVLIGNDFLPSLPGISIRHGTLDNLLEVMRGIWSQPNAVPIVSPVTGSVDFARLQNALREINDVSTYPSSEWINQHFEGGRTGSEYARACQMYMTGLDWVIQYYLRGCPNWRFYYPYYYAPCASDLATARVTAPAWTHDEPFSPLTQLLAILPRASSHCLPESFRRLMIQDTSPLQKYFPDKPKVDQDGKEREWEHIVLLPWIPDNVLVQCADNARASLSLEEAKRDFQGSTWIFTHRQSELGSLLSSSSSSSSTWTRLPESQMCAVAVSPYSYRGSSHTRTESVVFGHMRLIDG